MTILFSPYTVNYICMFGKTISTEIFSNWTLYRFITLSPGGKIKSKFQASTVQCKSLGFLQTSSSSHFPEQKEQINTFIVSVIMPLHFSINWSICIKTYY